MQDYLQHKKFLALKGKKPVFSASSSPSVSLAVSTVVPVGSPIALPSVSVDAKIKDYVHSLLSSFFSQSGSVVINPSLSAPTVVPDSDPPIRGVAGGLWAAILNRHLLTEPSGVVPPLQEETPPPPPPPPPPPTHNVYLHDVDYDRLG